MKIDRLIVAVAFVLALAVSPALAQPRPAASAPVQAPAQTTAAVPESKIALIYSDAFLDSKTGIAPASLSSLAACNANTSLALLQGAALVMRDSRLVTTQELDNARALGPFDPATGLPFGFQTVYLRGQAQTNTAVRLSQSLFAKLGDFRMEA